MTAAQDASLVYAARRGLFGPEGEWRLTPTSLVWRPGSGPQQTYPLAAVAQMRLFRHPPSRTTPGCVVCELVLPTKRVRLEGCAWRGPLRGPGRDAPAFRAFIAALAQAVARSNPACRFVARPRISRHLPVVLARLAGLAVVAWGLIRLADGTLGEGLALGAAACGLLLAHEVHEAAICWRGTFSPVDIPESVLPRR